MRVAFPLSPILKSFVMTDLIFSIMLSASSVECAKLSEGSEQKACFQEMFYVGVDKLIADSLKDPTDVIQYGISETVRCQNFGGPYDGYCACFSANARNSYGARTGKQFQVFGFSILDSGLHEDLTILSGELVDAKICGTLRFTPRDSEKISKQIH